MNGYFDPSPPVVTPHQLVLTFTKSTPEELALPQRAVITFDARDLHYILARQQGSLVEAWSPFRQLYLLPGRRTIITRSAFGGPNIAALVEELCAFGVEEFVMWGYCGGIGPGLHIGDIVIPSAALREDGISGHYTDSDDAVVLCNWYDSWAGRAKDHGFPAGTVWSCDAIYRETKAKVAKYREMGVNAVEMEAASFYSVCNFHQARGIALLVVSDLLTEDSWIGGFRTKPFREGARRLSQFVLEEAIL